ncbi:MAG: 1-acyl-sn-glycerol-3-phosphate acyltransferase [Bacteroidetes bacterium HGW-Bacteroidetes-4]|jgi:1-acyl-sn-glycerol-3-phosphate acyltransferase|nr:MAG: 1-acyl-sn-glycerol-3-phosphate acyltransferase [Bacteroidetes bacterium HGW-Bacteroidetes-4]
MRKIIAYPLTLIHYALAALFLGIFHPIQVIAFNLFGYNAHKKVVDVLNFFLVQNMYTLLCRPVFKGFDQLPVDVPLIVVANHQSMYDISPVIWGFRKHHVKFIAKKELGKNLPSVSYNLHKGGSVLIDRESGSQAIKEILKLGKRMGSDNWSACIFPEGTRSKTGQLRTFQPAGFKTLLKAAPNALIVPFVIDGNYKLHPWGYFPLNFGIKLNYTALSSIKRTDFADEELLDRVKNLIEQEIKA